jgi:sulfite reductase alpha subunit-like flavoprotein
VISSTGEGESPDNGKKFTREVRKKIQVISKDPRVSEALSSMKFYILGLGSSEYAKYQGYPTLVQTSLQSLGAQMQGEFGKADELKDHMATVRGWTENLWTWLKSKPEAQTAVALRNLKVCILYASKSGNTQAIAESLRDILTGKGFDTTLMTMNEWETSGIEGDNLNKYFVLMSPTVDYGKMPPNGE